MIRKFSFLLLLPAIVLHELTHAAFGYPWSNKIEIDLWPDARVFQYYSEDVPRLVYRVVNLAPTIVGSSLAIVVLWAYPNFVLELWSPIGIYLLGLWTIYTVPSRPDLFPFDYVERVD